MHLKDFGISKLEKSSKTILRVEISTDEKGEAVQKTLLVIRGNKDGPILLLTRGVHGDLVKFWLILPAVMRASFQFLKECKFNFF